jgi:NAD-dependent malate dehydrogenase
MAAVLAIEESITMKVTVVGSGFVGQTTAMRVLQNGLADQVVLTDIVEGLPQGLALDLQESAPVERFEPNILGTNDYGDTAGSDVVVITAGFPRQPGMSRMDLLGKNAGIMKDVIGEIAPRSPDAIVIVVTNPLDEMTFLAADASGFPKERVMGMAGVLDSARLRFFIAEELGVSPLVVEAMTLGSHGDAMIALPRHATVDGRPLPELVDQPTLDRLFQRTRDGGAEIVAPEVAARFLRPADVVNAVERDVVEQRRRASLRGKRADSTRHSERDRNADRPQDAHNVGRRHAAVKPPTERRPDAANAGAGRRRDRLEWTRESRRGRSQVPPAGLP